MCGIFCALSSSRLISPNPHLQHLLECRGPDSCDQRYCNPPWLLDEDGPNKVYFYYSASVLSLRGAAEIRQPYSSHARMIFCWNGEAWSIKGAPVYGNDTVAVFDILYEACTHPFPSLSRQKEVLVLADRISWSLSQIAGPYAFVFHDLVKNLVFFGRDFLGRRSLLTSVTDDGDLLISSVSDGTNSGTWAEVEADGVYCIDLHASLDDLANVDHIGFRGLFVVTKAPYHFAGDVAPESNAIPVIPRLSLNQNLPAFDAVLNEASPAVEKLEGLLRCSLALRVTSIPEPPSQPTTNFDFMTAKLAILFSGGLDCTVLARLAHDVLPPEEPIDLLNVAFENPRVQKASSVDVSAYELCPDRITGRSSCNELRHVCAGREWRFVAINVSYPETLEHKQKVITLMHPHNTEMDLSISYALYFAARGRGAIATSNSDLVEYTTSARVLLSGLGADELFGGYQRHATSFERNGHVGLLQELDLDISRLGKRNLGRDDRIISNWGREARFPYLDEHLMEWALTAPVTSKCGFGERGPVERRTSGDSSESLEPGKKVLRCLAWKLSMRGVANEKKRAIQFGARTVKMESGKTKGTHVLS